MSQEFSTRAGGELQPAPAGDTDSCRNDALLFDRLPAMVWSALGDGYFDYGNARYLEYIGLTAEQAAGSGWEDAVHPDDLDGLRACWADLIESGKDGQYELRFGNPDKGYRWSVSQASPHRDADGKVVRWYGSTLDIQDRRCAEDALRRRAADALRTSEAYLAQAQRLSHTGSFGLHLPSGRTHWSEETYRICGYGHDVTPSLERFIEVAHPDDRERLRGALCTPPQSGQIALDYRLLLANGISRHVRLMAQATLSHAGVEFVGAIVDETENREAADRLEEARANLAHVSRIATMGQLTASIAHEVSQPLAGILVNGGACLRWLKREQPEIDEVRASVERIVASAERATCIINNLHALARREPPKRTLVDLNTVVEETVAFVRSEVNRSGIFLELQLDRGAPMVAADRVQIQQLFINIINNAIQAMAGSVEAIRQIRVRTHQTATSRVVVDIADTGPGIRGGDLERLFTPFFSTKDNGMGMGLSICRTIMEHHGGSIHVSNNSGPGATFHIEFPLDA